MPVRRLAALVLLLLLAAPLAACGRTVEDDFSPAALAEAAKKAGTVNGLCPVMKKPVIVGLASDYKGEKVGFCCTPCKPKFDADPEKYMSPMRADPDRYSYRK